MEVLEAVPPRHDRHAAGAGPASLLDAPAQPPDSFVAKPMDAVQSADAERIAALEQKAMTRLVQHALDRGCDFNPDGWRIHVKQRKAGNSRGDVDYYFYSPEGKRFRSQKEVVSMLLNVAALEAEAQRTKDAEAAGEIIDKPPEEGPWLRPRPPPAPAADAAPWYDAADDEALDAVRAASSEPYNAAGGACEDGALPQASCHDPHGAVAGGDAGDAWRVQVADSGGAGGGKRYRLNGTDGKEQTYGVHTYHQHDHKQHQQGGSSASHSQEDGSSPLDPAHWHLASAPSPPQPLSHAARNPRTHLTQKRSRSFPSHRQPPLRPLKRESSYALLHGVLHGGHRAGSNGGDSGADAHGRAAFAGDDGDMQHTNITTKIAERSRCRSPPSYSKLDLLADLAADCEMSGLRPQPLQQEALHHQQQEQQQQEDVDDEDMEGPALSGMHLLHGPSATAGAAQHAEPHHHHAHTAVGLGVLLAQQALNSHAAENGAADDSLDVPWIVTTHSVAAQAAGLPQLQPCLAAVQQDSLCISSVEPVMGTLSPPAQQDSIPSGGLWVSPGLLVSPKVSQPHQSGVGYHQLANLAVPHLLGLQQLASLMRLCGDAGVAGDGGEACRAQIGRLEECLALAQEVVAEMQAF